MNENELQTAAAQVIDVHRGWCNFCKGNADFCRDFTSKTPSACSVPRLEVAISALRPAEPSAIADVIAERERQISKEGWTAEHDDEHASRELAVVAVCYAQQYVGRAWLLEDFKDGLTRYQDDDLPDEWPAAWHEGWWKPKDPRRDLVRAAALLIAEIDRLDRINPPDLGR